MLAAVVVQLIVGAPLSTSQAVGLLAVDAKAVVFTSARYMALPPQCQRHADVILRGTARDVFASAVAKDSALSVACMTPRYPKLAAAIDASAGRCAGGFGNEECQAWLAHARAAVLDLLADDTTQSTDFAHFFAAMTAIGFADPLSPTLASVAVASAMRLSEERARDDYVQRIALAAALSLPGSDTDMKTAFAQLLGRALDTNPTDADVLGALVVVAERANALEAATVIVDKALAATETPTAKAYMYYLNGCMLLLKTDPKAAHDDFVEAARIDPFNVRYRRAVDETKDGAAAEAKCNIVFSPFSTMLKTVLAPRR